MVRPVSPVARPRGPRWSGRAFPPVARVLLALVLVFSLLLSVGAPVAAALGLPELGTSLARNLVLTADTLPGFRLGALFTSSCVNLSENPASLFLTLLILALFRLRDLPWLLRTRWRLLLGWFVGLTLAGTLINRYLVPGVWGLLGALLIVGVMAPTVERMFGARPFARFCVVVTGVTNLVGALVYWLWPGSVAALLGPSAAVPQGIGPLTGAWFLVFVLVLDRRSLGGADGPGIAINGRALAFLLLAMGVYTLLFTGFLAGLMDLLAMAMAFWHVQGGGSLTHLLDRLQLWRLERRRARFRVVRGGRDDGRIVHRTITLGGAAASPLPPK